MVNVGQPTRRDDTEQSSHPSDQRGWLDWLRGWLNQVSRQPALRTEPAEYPRYLVCPRCGEPEVEVWNCDHPVRCHQCQQTFACSEADETGTSQRS
jgi:hypothetical protein